MSSTEELAIMEAVRQVKARYFRFTDSKNWTELATVFCKNASFGGKQTHVGVTTIVDVIVRGTAEVTTVHHGHNHEVWVDSPEQAHSITAFEDRGYSNKTKELVMHGLGHYHETYRLEDGAWRISQCKIMRRTLVDKPR